MGEDNLLLVGIGGWQLAKRLGLFGASVIGPLLIGIPLSLTGILSERPSQELIMVAQYFIGIGIGVNYKGLTVREVRRDILATSGFVLLLVALATACIALSTLVSNVSAVQRFLSFWPTGQAEIAILSLAAGANVGVVVIHHLVRMVFIILGAPLTARFFMSTDAQDTS
ncbi:MAG: AbrB family transcriptional regulator [Granulosicoccus sp.]